VKFCTARKIFWLELSPPLTADEDDSSDATALPLEISGPGFVFPLAELAVMSTMAVVTMNKPNERMETSFSRV
jgi:hypothetical protein